MTFFPFFPTLSPGPGPKPVSISGAAFLRRTYSGGRKVMDANKASIRVGVYEESVGRVAQGLNRSEAGGGDAVRRGAARRGGRAIS